MAGTGCTFTFIRKVFSDGDRRAVVLSAVVSGSSSWHLNGVDFGLSNIDYALVTPVSISTTDSAGWGVKRNIRSATTASPGTLAGSGFTSGDVIVIYAVGVS